MALIVSPLGDGLTAREGAASTFSDTATVCGLPLMVIPLLSTAAMEMSSLYGPAPSDAVVAVTVNVALPPAITAEVGVTVSQRCVTVGVMEISPLQAPVIPMVKL